MPGPRRVYTSAEKKQRKRDYCHRYYASTVHIGEVIDDWNVLRESLGLKKDAELAETLIRSFKKDADVPGPPFKRRRRMFVTSTPEPGTRRFENDHSSTLSVPSTINQTSGSTHTAKQKGHGGSTTLSAVGTSIHDESDCGTSGIEAGTSGIEALSSTSQSDDEMLEKQRAVDEAVDEADDTILTARFEEISEYTVTDAGAGYEEDDETYVPSAWEMSINVPLPPDATTVSEEADLVDMVHDIESEEEEEEDVQGVDKGPVTKKLVDVDPEDEDDQMFMVSRSALTCLTDLLSLSRCDKPLCKEDVDCQEKSIGCGLVLKWVCRKGHIVHSWTSQSVLPNNVLLGNMKFAAAIVLSGNNYGKVALLCKFLKIGIPSKSSFNRIQGNYIVPEVDKFWLNMKLTAQEELRAQSVVVAGDGRMDSPGHCAKYCTYTLMNQEDKSILAMEIVDKRECQLKSTLMEATGFRKALKDVGEAGINISEVVTNAHPQISSIMKKEHSELRHSWDMWHGAKNLGKKLCSAASEKGNAKLKPWIGDITNHFFYAAEHCNGNEDCLKVKLASVVNHCLNRHSWGLGSCDHEEMDQDVERTKEWLNPNGQEVVALERILLDARFQNTMKYYVTCQYPVYKCRCQLAAIDYTSHLNRPQRRNKKGEYYYTRYFSKAANQWNVKYVLIPKDYDYIPHLVLQILREFCKTHKEKPLRTRRELTADDPRHIAPNIAQAEAPPTHELAQKKRSRVQKAWRKT